MVTTEVDTFMIPVVIDDATGVYTYKWCHNCLPSNERCSNIFHRCLNIVRTSCGLTNNMLIGYLNITYNVI
jgi:hypothetical protein